MSDNQLENIEKSLSAFEKAAKRVISLHEADAVSVSASEIEELVFKAEKACVALRKMPYLLPSQLILDRNRVDLDRTLAEAHQIEIKKDKNGYPYVKIPRLLPSRNTKATNNDSKKKEKKRVVSSTGGSLDFARVPLQAALSKYTETNGYPQKSIEKQTLIVIHGYPYDIPKFRCRDHDNYELKGIIDDIASYFLADDSIIYCDRLYLSKPDNDFYTEFIIVPSEKLADWVSEFYCTATILS